MLRLRDPETTLTTVGAATEPATIVAEQPTFEFPSIEAYIAELRVSLRGATLSQIDETCHEMRLHLQASAMAMVELGEAVETAEEEALRRFGAVKAHCEAVSGELRRKSRWASKPAALRCALGTFAIVQLLEIFCASMQTAAILGHTAPLMHLYWQCGGPLFVLLAPAVIGGWHVGRQTRGRAVGATALAIPALGLGMLLALSMFFGFDAVLGAFVHRPGQDSTPILLDLLATMFLYNVARYPLSVAAAAIASRSYRRAARVARG